MLVSVVVCGYTLERTEVLCDCIESALSQTYEPIEVVVVIDGNDELAEIIEDRFGEDTRVQIVENDSNRGISYSRTRGGEEATGEIVAFIDDDAVAEPDWIERLVEVYESTDALAVGGYVAPNWVEGKPAFFPEEFYWLVGCTEREFATDGDEVRNTYGSNISYKRDVFLAVGGYDVNTGRKGDRHIQAHEAPVGIRIREQYDRGMIYVEDAVVHHTLFAYRGNFRWLVARSFWQGVSKRLMSTLYSETYGDESRFLRKLCFRFLPRRIRQAVFGPSMTQAKQIVAIITFTLAVGLGYVYGLLRRDLTRADGETPASRHLE